MKWTVALGTCAALLGASAWADEQAVQATEPRFAAYSLVGPRVTTSGGSVLPSLTVAGSWSALRRGRFELQALAPISLWSNSAQSSTESLPTTTALVAVEGVPSGRALAHFGQRFAAYADVGLGIGLGVLTRTQQFQGGTRQLNDFGVFRVAVGGEVLLGRRWTLSVEPFGLNAYFGSASASVLTFLVGAGYRL